MGTENGAKGTENKEWVMVRWLMGCRRNEGGAKAGLSKNWKMMHSGRPIIGNDDRGKSCIKKGR